MGAIIINAIVGPDRHLTVDLPDDVPLGPVEVLIRPVSVVAFTDGGAALTREEVRARLDAAGLLSHARYAPLGTVPLSDKEAEALGRLFADVRLTSELIDEDRGEY